MIGLFAFPFIGLASFLFFENKKNVMEQGCRDKEASSLFVLLIWNLIHASIKNIQHMTEYKSCVKRRASGEEFSSAASGYL